MKRISDKEIYGALERAFSKQGIDIFGEAATKIAQSQLEADRKWVLDRLKYYPEVYDKPASTRFNITEEEYNQLKGAV